MKSPTAESQSQTNPEFFVTSFFRSLELHGRDREKSRLGRQGLCVALTAFIHAPSRYAASLSTVGSHDAQAEFKLVERNLLGEMCWASPAVSDGAVVLPDAELVLHQAIDTHAPSAPAWPTRLTAGRDVRREITTNKVPHAARTRAAQLDAADHRHLLRGAPALTAAGLSPAGDGQGQIGDRRACVRRGRTYRPSLMALQ